MNLNELILKLQAVARSTNGGDVKFQFADVNPNGHTTRQAYLLDISDEGKECLITFGNDESDAEVYKGQIETMKEQNVR